MASTVTRSMAERIQQCREGIGLRRGRGIGGQGRARIAEARRRDPAVALGQEGLGQQPPLVVPAAGAVDRQHRRARAARTVGDRTEGCLGHADARAELGAQVAHVALIGQPHRARGQSTATSKIRTKARRITGPIVQTSITAATGRRSERGIGGA
jgi:hypothetical protein